MRNLGLGSWPVRRARMTPHAIAVRHDGTGLTYGELARRVARLARGLRAAGVRPGDRVAYLGPDHPAYLEILFACGQAGAVFVPLNFRLSVPELDYALADSGATVLIHTPEHAETVATLAGQRLLRGPAGELDAPEDEPLDLPVGLDEVRLLMYTSGSTGRPKAAMLTHGNLTWNSVNVLVETDLASDERSLVAAPLFHAAALGMICLPTLLKGGTVILRSAFDPGTALSTVERDRVTLMFGVPTMYQAMAAHPRWETADLSSVRTLLCGGAPVPSDTIRRYLDRNLVFAQGYGMTEAAPGVLVRTARTPGRKQARPGRRCRRGRRARSSSAGPT